MINYITVIFIFFFGAVVGSFLNVVILRLPKGQPLTGRSHCPHCGRVLSAADLVPLFSFLFLGGRCRKCHKPISWRYFIIELITACLFAGSFLIFSPVTNGDVLMLLKVLMAVCIFVVIFTIDLEHFLILDSVVFSGLALANILNLIIDIFAHNLFSWHGNFVSGIIMAIVMAIPFFALWYFSGGRWMGFGDVKLALLLGTILGWPLSLVGLFLGICLGGVVSVFLLIFGSQNLKSKVPFGTFLTVGAVAAMFFGHQILTWYLATLGF